MLSHRRQLNIVTLINFGCLNNTFFTNFNCMDWLSILTLPGNYQTVWLLVNGNAIRGTFGDYPNATKWAHDEVVY